MKYPVVVAAGLVALARSASAQFVMGSDAFDNVSWPDADQQIPFPQPVTPTPLSADGIATTSQAPINTGREATTPSIDSPASRNTRSPGTQQSLSSQELQKIKEPSGTRKTANAAQRESVSPPQEVSRPLNVSQSGNNTLQGNTTLANSETSSGNHTDDDKRQQSTTSPAKAIAEDAAATSASLAQSLESTNSSGKATSTGNSTDGVNSTSNDTNSENSTSNKPYQPPVRDFLPSSSSRATLNVAVGSIVAGIWMLL